MSKLLDIRIQQGFENRNLFFFHNYSANEFKKQFSLITPSIYGTTHTKKIATSIQNYYLIKLSSFSKPYFTYLFQPSTSNEEILKREQLLKTLMSISIDNSSIIEKFQNLTPLIYPTISQIQVYTTQEDLREYFNDNFAIPLLVIQEEEVEEMGAQQDSVFVGDSYMLCFEKEYKRHEFENFLRGSVFYEEREKLAKLLNLFDENYELFSQFEQLYQDFFSKEFAIDKSVINMKEYLNQQASPYTKAKEFVEEIRERVNQLNEKISQDLKEKTISLTGDEVVALLQNNATTSLQEKISSSYTKEFESLNNDVSTTLSSLSISPKKLFSSTTYPFELDEEELSEVIEEASEKGEESKKKFLEQLGSFMSFNYCDELFSYCYFVEVMLFLHKEFNEQSYEFITHNQELLVENLRHFFIADPTPVSYCLGGKSCQGLELREETVSLVTGANSGGKTTLVESVIQGALLSSMGFPIKGDSTSSIPIFNKITYLKKFTGTQGSGAFEQTLKQLLELLEDDDSNQLIIVDELEAVTEPGAAATILLSFLRELAKQNKYAIAISHLGEELENLVKSEGITTIRIDGISAEGLDEKGKLITNHQPHFYSRGKSTPELIMKRVLMDEKFWKDKSSKTKEIFTSLFN